MCMCFAFLFVLLRVAFAVDGIVVAIFDDVYDDVHHRLVAVDGVAVIHGIFLVIPVVAVIVFMIIAASTVITSVFSFVFPLPM